MTEALRIGPLTSANRARVEEIVRAAAVFSEDEVAVALEVFDAGMRPESGLPISDAPLPISDYQLLGAFLGSALLGYACFGPTPSTDRTYDLYWIAVHPDAQRSGAGSALMDAVEARLREDRARLLAIETSSRDDYEPTRRFYDKRGYQESARIRDFYAPGDDRLVLTRRLDAAPSPGGPDRSFPVPAPHL